MSTTTIEIEIVGADGAGETAALPADLGGSAVIAGVRATRADEGVALQSAEGSEALLPWHGELVFEGKLWRVGGAPAPNAGSTSASKPILIAALVVAVAAVFLLGPASSDATARPAPAAPELFPAEATCELARAGNAPALEERGNALRERYPFAPEVGLEAVERLEAAAACHALRSDLVRAQASARAAERLRARVEADFRAMRFRLGRSLEQGRAPQALREVRAMSALLRDREGEYTEWLRELERALSRRGGGAS